MLINNKVNHFANLSIINSLQFMTALTNIGGWEYQSFWQQTNPSVMMPQALLTKFHQQGQQDPQRDLKGLPDVVIVEGEDGESLFVGS